jgi:hypothetical protein
VRTGNAETGARRCPVRQYTMHLMDIRFVECNGAPEALASVQPLFDVDPEVVISLELARGHEFDPHNLVRARNRFLVLEITRFGHDFVSQRAQLFCDICGLLAK